MQYRDGETRNIGGVQYTRQGGQWLPQAASPQPIIAPQPAPVRPVQQQLDELRLQREQRELSTEEGVDTPGDVNLEGDAYLRSLPSSMQSQVRALSEGRLAMPTGRAAAAPYWQRIMQATGHFDPSFDAANYQTRVSTRRNFTSGVARRNITALNTAIGHLDTLSQRAEELSNTDWPVINRVRNFGRQQSGDPRIDQFNLARQAVVDELERAFRGSAGSVTGIEHWRDSINAAQSPEQLHGAITQAIELLDSRVNALGEEYNAGMGRADDPMTLLSPHSREVLGRINPGRYGEPEEHGPPLVGGFSDELPTQRNNYAPGGEQLAGQLAAAVRSGRVRTGEQYMALARQLNPELANRYDPAVVNGIMRDYRRALARDPRTQFEVNIPLNPTPAETEAQNLDRVQGQMDSGDLAQHGAMLNFGDEAAGVGGALRNAVTAPFMADRDFDPVGAYQVSRDADRLRVEGARERGGTVGSLAEIAGGFASGRLPMGGASIAGAPLAAVERSMPSALPQSLMGRIGSGAKAGASVGTLAGFGQGEGAGDSLINASIGGTLGGAIGGAFPLAGAGIRSVGRAGRNLLGRNPNAGMDAIEGAVAADTVPPTIGPAEPPALRIQRGANEAAANDVPYMPADSGPNARGLLAASARAPGPSRTVAQGNLQDRQEGLGERITGAIERDLGSTANPMDVGDNLISNAQATAAPLYEATYAAPGAGRFGQRIMGLLNRPSMQRALDNAARLAREEGRDPTTMGFDVNSSGEITLSRTPSWQTFDYVKRGLDDVIEGFRDPTSGRLNLNTEGRAVNSTQRDFMRMFDEANPAYAQARAAYAGPVRMKSALERGTRALNMSADDLARLTRDMTPGERAMFQHGARYAMAQQAASRGDTANIVHALVGTGKKRLMMTRLFGGGENMTRFLRTLRQEQAGFETFRSASLGSPTAANLGNDRALDNAVTTGALDMMTTGVPVATGLRAALRYGSERAGNNARQRIASVLSETDPARIAGFTRDMRARSIRELVRGQRGAGLARAYGVLGGETMGSIFDPEEQRY